MEREAFEKFVAQEPVHSVQSNGRHSPLLTHMMNKMNKRTAAQPAQEPDWKTMPQKDAPLVQWTKEQPAHPQPAQPKQGPTDIAALVKGMEVSVDVSTGEHDSGNRLFGTVTLAQQNQGSKHGLILLVQDPEPNFKPALSAQEPVAWALEWAFDGEEKGRRLYDDERHCKLDAENDGGICRPLVYGYTAPPQREWVGLTEPERNDIEDYCEMIIGKAAFDAIEAKLKERNHGT